MKISLLLVTHNIDEVLIYQSPSWEILSSFVDEAIIVNTGKLKYELKIPKKQKTRIITYKFNNYFPDAKNYALAKAKGDWILTIDTDEIFEDSLLRKIPDLVNNSRIDGYWFRRKTFINKHGKYLKYGLFYPDWQLRLFRNKKEYRYAGGVHALLPIPKKRTHEIELDIQHFPTVPKYESFSNFKNLIGYINMDSTEFSKNSNLSWLGLVFKGMNGFITIFFSGYFRGKGFLDGWAGFRAHLMFASSVGLSYLLAAWKKAKRDYVH